MHDHEPIYEVRSFVVRVGHTQVRVQGKSKEEAIREARRQLSLDLPRMWDVIHSLDDSRFEIAGDC